MDSLTRDQLMEYIIQFKNQYKEILDQLNQVLEPIYKNIPNAEYTFRINQINLLNNEILEKLDYQE